MTEPTTAITDLILGVLTLYFARKILLSTKGMGKSSAFYWGLAFVSTGIAALLGMVYHGAKDLLSVEATLSVSLFTLISVGFTSYFIAKSLANSFLSESKRKLIGMLLIVKFIVFLWFYIEERSFLYAVLDYGSVMLVAISAYTYRWISKKDLSDKFLSLGVIITILGTVIQQSGFDIHEHFNHNDIYHVIQMYAVYLLSKGIILDSKVKI